jgi:hypothetical protein
VIAELFRHLEAVDRRFHTLFAPLRGGDPDDANKAAESYNDLQAYYRRNSIWLPLRASKQCGDFLARYRDPLIEFTYEVIHQEQAAGRLRKWNEVWTNFRTDSPKIRQALETEFRAALGSYRAKLAILLEFIPASRQDQESTASERHSPGPG